MAQLILLLNLPLSSFPHRRSFRLLLDLRALLNINGGIHLNRFYTAMSSSSAPASTDPSSNTQTSSTLATSQNTQRQAEARAAVTASLQSVGSSYDADLATRARDLHTNSKAINKQEAELQKQTEKLRKENDKLEKLMNKGTKSLNEFGDVQNWAETIERELLVVEETLRLVAEKEEGAQNETAQSQTI